MENGKKTNKLQPQKLKQIVIKDRETKEIINIFKPCKQTESKARDFEAMRLEVVRIYE